MIRCSCCRRSHLLFAYEAPQNEHFIILTLGKASTDACFVSCKSREGVSALIFLHRIEEVCPSSEAGHLELFWLEGNCQMLKRYITEAASDLWFFLALDIHVGRAHDGHKDKSSSLYHFYAYMGRTLMHESTFKPSITAESVTY